MSATLDEVVQLLRDFIGRADARFDKNEIELAGLAEVSGQALAGVRMALAGIESVGEALGKQAQATRDVADGLVTLSTQVSQLRDGVASQVHHEVVKSLDAERSIEVLADLPQEER